MHLCQSANKDGSLLCDVRKTGRFTHVMYFPDLGDVSGKRFITHGGGIPDTNIWGAGFSSLRIVYYLCR